MAIIKCKMCGGDIELTADKTFGTCEFCGSTMTLPKIDDDQRAAAFNRGNHFRRIGEFDKALAVYERIVREDDTDAEAHWCCALCRFGIEYVEDPATYEWLPTCHRASFDSFLEDVDYKAAVEYSEGITKRQYMKDGAKIAEVQRGILATSQNAEPYDVFICYKESDENGNRTRDSLMAQDIYYQLTEQGRKVFFARITLEDVAGAQYEPYIFAALNSAKVMIVVGTKPEHLSAVWVKNEWSRFLAMMKKDRHKLLLPCYRDMDPYDMPEALSVLQSYDMSKIGFIQDLTRGIAKVLDAEKKPEPVKETVVMQQTGGANTVSLLKRAFMFLEDGEWGSADEYCEKVLDIDPENARAYLGKLMAELRVKKQESLKDQEKPFEKNNNYQKAIRFDDGELRNALQGYISHIERRNEETRLDAIYAKANRESASAVTERDFLAAAATFAQIPQWKDAAAREKQCRERAETCRKNAVYDKATSLMRSADAERVMRAVPLLRSISGWKDADELAGKCPEYAEAARKNSQYNDAFRMAQNDTEEALRSAIAQMEQLAGWKDSESQIQAFQARIEEIQEQKRQAILEEQRRLEAVERKRLEMEAEAKAREEAQRVEWERQKEISRKEAAVSAKKKRISNVITMLVLGIIIAATVVLVTVIIPQNRYREAVALRDAGNDIQAAYAFSNIKDYSDAKDQAKELWDQIAQRKTIAAYGNYTMAVKNDGTVVGTGTYNSGITGYADWEDIIAVSAGEYHTVALKSDGTVEATGGNAYGQCNVHAWTDIVAIAVGGEHTLGLYSNGKVDSRGAGTYGRTNVRDWENIIAIAAGAEHSVGLKADGTVVANGHNKYGQCDVSAWEDIVAIAAGRYHTLGLKSDGSVVFAGEDTYGWDDISTWKDIVAIAAGNEHAVGLKADGTVVAVGSNWDGQCDVGNWQDIVDICAGGNHTVGLKADGTVVAVGFNMVGQCAVDDWSGIKLPK